MDKKSITEIPVDEVVSLGKALKTVNSKPYVAIVVCIVVSVILILTQKIAVLGILILPFAVFALWKIPDEKQLAFYEHFLIIYPNREQSLAQKVSYDDILEWTVRQGTQTGDSFVLHLKDDEYVNVNCFNSGKVVRFMNSIMPEKEAQRKKTAEMKNTPFKWPWKKS